MTDEQRPQHSLADGKLHHGVFDDISMAYQGPYFATADNSRAWFPSVQDNMHETTAAFGADSTGAAWDLGGIDSVDWSWLNADLPVPRCIRPRATVK